MAFPVQLFLLSTLAACPPVLLIFYLQSGLRLSGEAFHLFIAFYLAFLGLLLPFLWHFCHQPFHVLSNLINSLHQGDYSMRIAPHSKGDAFALLTGEINRLADLLQNNRLASLESRKRFQYLIDHLEVGVLTCDEDHRLVLCNRVFARWLDRTREALCGVSLGELDLEALVSATNGRTLWLGFGEKNSRYLVNASQFREEGRNQLLFVLSDLSHPLREEERQSWKRLIRVLGHELNNSLTPIISLSQSLHQRISKMEMEAAKRESTLDALHIIAQRAKGLSRFVEDYGKLAKLPEPKRELVLLAPLLRRVAQLMQLPGLSLREGPELNLRVDAAHLEQALLNLLRNASEAIPERGGEVHLSWFREGNDALIRIDDNGPGIGESENLFVPFFSTKPQGSGIGLVLSRQMIEANGGTLALINRPEGGCRAELRLPLL
jgi:signal transduction histidine kinase